MTRVLQLQWHLRPIARRLSQSGIRITNSLLAGSDPESGNPEVLRLVAHAQGLYDALRDEIRAIESLGGEVKDVEAGLIDFYSLRDGTQEVLLCWRLGEARITHYHELNAGYSGRQPIQGHRFVAGPRQMQ